MSGTAVHHQSAVGLRVWFGRTRGMARAHTHHDLEFNCVRRGSVRYLVGGQVLTIPAGRLAVLWGAMPHQTLDATADLDMAWGTAPLHQALLTALPASFVTVLLGRGVVIDVEPRAEDWPLFERWERDLATGASARCDLVVREMELRLHRLALDTAMARDSVEAGPVGCEGLQQVQRMAAFMARHYARPLPVEAVAAAVHLHPNYAMTLFRRHTGMTVGAFLTRQRVAHAQRLLATTDTPILAVGLASGFGSSSRFFEAFKNHAHCSPRAYRRKLTGG